MPAKPDDLGLSLQIVCVKNCGYFDLFPRIARIAAESAVDFIVILKI
jgi:hypothetical protein